MSITFLKQNIGINYIYIPCNTFVFFKFLCNVYALRLKYQCFKCNYGGLLSVAMDGQFHTKGKNQNAINITANFEGSVHVPLDEI